MRAHSPASCARRHPGPRLGETRARLRCTMSGPPGISKRGFLHCWCASGCPRAGEIDPDQKLRPGCAPTGLARPSDSVRRSCLWAAQLGSVGSARGAGPLSGRGRRHMEGSPGIAEGCCATDCRLRQAFIDLCAAVFIVPIAQRLSLSSAQLSLALGYPGRAVSLDPALGLSTPRRRPSSMLPRLA